MRLMAWGCVEVLRAATDYRDKAIGLVATA
jgi:hypothetical protein